MLGVSRAIGEAMAVMMVSGNAPNMPSLFESVRFLTTAVASEMSYASGLQRQALFSIALVLYLFIMLINAALNFFPEAQKRSETMLTNKLSAARRVYTAVMRALLLLAAVLTAALVVFMIVYVLYKGLPYVTWHLISTKPSYITGAIGILPDICNTMQILLASPAHCPAPRRGARRSI